MISSYKADGILSAMFNRHKAPLSLSMNERDSQEKGKEPMRRWVEISDRSGELLLLDHSILLSFRDTRVTTQWECSKAHPPPKKMSTSERINLLCQRLQEIICNQKAVFDQLMDALKTKRSWNWTTKMIEKKCSLQRRAGTGILYTFNYCNNVLSRRDMSC